MIWCQSYPYLPSVTAQPISIWCLKMQCSKFQPWFLKFLNLMWVHACSNTKKELQLGVGKYMSKELLSHGKLLVGYLCADIALQRVCLLLCSFDYLQSAVFQIYISTHELGWILLCLKFEFEHFGSPQGLCLWQLLQTQETHWPGKLLSSVWNMGTTRAVSYMVNGG